MPDPDEIIRRFEPEFEKLLLITLMEDWDCDITSADAEATLRRFTDGPAPPEMVAVNAPRRARRSVVSAAVAAANPQSTAPRIPGGLPAVQ